MTRNIKKKILVIYSQRIHNDNKFHMTKENSWKKPSEKKNCCSKLRNIFSFKKDKMYLCTTFVVYLPNAFACDCFYRYWYWRGIYRWIRISAGCVPLTQYKSKTKTERWSKWPSSGTTWYDTWWAERSSSRKTRNERHPILQLRILRWMRRRWDEKLLLFSLS